MSGKLRFNFKKLGSKENGSSLLEAVIALGVLGIAAIVILSALVTGTKATNLAWEQATAESLSRSEIEYIKTQTYIGGNTTYDVDYSLLDDYVDVGWEIIVGPAEPVEGGLQKVTVTIERDDKTVLSVVTYKGEKS